MSEVSEKYAAVDKGSLESEQAGAARKEQTPEAQRSKEAIERLKQEAIMELSVHKGKSKVKNSFEGRRKSGRKKKPKLKQADEPKRKVNFITSASIQPSQPPNEPPGKIFQTQTETGLVSRKLTMPSQLFQSFDGFNSASQQSGPTLLKPSRRLEPRHIKGGS